MNDIVKSAIKGATINKPNLSTFYKNKKKKGKSFIFAGKGPIKTLMDRIRAKATKKVEPIKPKKSVGAPAAYTREIRDRSQASYSKVLGKLK